MKKSALFTSIAIVSFVLVACSSNKEKNEEVVKIDYEQCYYPDAPEKKAPGWVCDQPFANLTVQATGSHPKSAAGYDFSKRQAAASARTALAAQFSTEVQAMIKQFTETTGTADSETVDQVNSSVSRNVTKQRLEGSKIYMVNTSPNGQVYVLMGMDKDTTIFNTQAAIRTSMADAKAAWQRAAAGKSFEELNEEMRKFQDSQY